jgi:hypothetical protein
LGGDCNSESEYFYWQFKSRRMQREIPTVKPWLS